MKNGKIQPLLFLTCTFAAFLLGLFAGRVLNNAPLQVHVQDATPAAVGADMEAPTGQPNSPTAEKPILNLNTATSRQLQTLPGIGEVLAERILSYRDANGAFQSIGDLVNVPGIDGGTLDAIWDYVTVGG